MEPGEAERNRVEPGEAERNGVESGEAERNRVEPGEAERNGAEQSGTGGSLSGRRQLHRLKVGAMNIVLCVAGFAHHFKSSLIKWMRKPVVCVNIPAKIHFK